MPIPPLEALAGSSLVTLQEMELKALNQSANHSKGVKLELDQWVEALALAMVARWMIDSRRAASPAPPKQLDLWDKLAIRDDLPSFSVTRAGKD